MILCYDHVQVMIPTGELTAALAFYINLLGFTRVPKPDDMRQSGAWLVCGDVKLHLGEDLEINANDFVPSPQAHPAMRVDNFDELMDKAKSHGLKVRIDKGPSGFQRGSIWDPFGNRIELMQKQ
jgi:catechol 2,3-dioxygenase-like lactoylglutathione lyase family enzyme